MKSSVSNRSAVDFYRYLILFILLDLAQRTSSAVLPSHDAVSLYTAADKVTVLTAQNFSSTIYGSKTAWLIEFYASWCGHCQSYANTYREVAIDTLGWKTVVRIGAINCYAEENSAVCEEHNIMAYPTLRLIPPESSTNTSKSISLTATDSKDVERELIKELDALHRTDKTWPNFSPVNRASFDDLYERIPPTVRLVLVIVEKRDDYTGRQIMLDFSKYYEQLAIFRATTDGKFWLQFQLNITDVPAIFIIRSDRTAEQIPTQRISSNKLGSRNLFHYAIRSYIKENKSIDNFDDNDLEEIIQSKNALNNAEALKNYNQNTPETVNNIVPQKISMVDLETALSYMFRREIPRIKLIQGETYDALVHWLTVLVKYFPGREPVMTYLEDLLSKLNEQSNGLTGKRFRELVDINTSTSYLPKNQIRYEYCTGSSPQYRGYPCAIWLLFHMLTVAQIQSEPRRMNVIEIPSTVRNFIKHFFGCRHCSENFMNETHNLHQLDSGDRNAAMIYLWKIHNHVNQRLRGDETEDPKHPKIQFPPETLCPECQSTHQDGKFDLTKTTEFLLRFYSKENLDLLSVENLSQSPENKERYSMIELNGESPVQSRFIRFISSVIQRFPFYFFISFVVIIFLVRRRFCKGKRKRYTL